MNKFYGLFCLFCLLTITCCAQDIKTVDQCRAYREAWNTSTDKDIKTLSVPGLLRRGDQMMACAREIDKHVFTSGDTCDKTLDEAFKTISYSILASMYYQEAFNRIAWFMENKKLSQEFLDADKADKIRRPK